LQPEIKKRRTRLWLGIGLGCLIVLFVVLSLVRGGDGGVKVRVEDVKKGPVKQVVTASGSLEPVRSVNVSATHMGKITRLAVEEGDRVEKGQFLLEIDPLERRMAVSRIEASLKAARANLIKAEAGCTYADEELKRVRNLFELGLVPEQELETARTNYERERAGCDAAREAVAEEEALLESARHQLSQVTIHAGMAGVVTALNVDEGETAVVGTMNNPGTVLLTISDLSRMEVHVDVDETEVVDIRRGHPAEIRIDAFPDTTFRGQVTEIGNSPILRGGGGARSVDFEVVVRLLDSVPNIKPGLSASADITTASREDVLLVPIQALTVRDPSSLGGKKGASAADTSGGAEESEEAGDRADLTVEQEQEGVFVVEDGRAHFRSVRTGVAGASRCEVLSGLAAGETVITGPFRVLRDLRDGARVEVERD
jgi:HlyD family secretion protein